MSAQLCFFSEVGKIKNTKLEFYDLKPSEFKDLKKNQLSVDSCA